MTRTEGATPHRILALTDGSPESLAAVRVAAGLAKSTPYELRILHVAGLSEYPVLIAEADVEVADDRGQLILGEAAHVARSLGVDAEVVLRHGPAVTQILRYTREWPPDLIVMGTRGRTGARRILLVSVSASVARRTQVSVIFVHSTGVTTHSSRVGSHPS